MKQSPLRSDFKRFVAACPRDLAPSKTPIAAWPRPSGRVRKNDWLEHVATLHGGKSIARQLESTKKDLGFWHKRLVPYAYIVARTYDHDPIVQVVSGTYAGQIVLIGHESYYDWWHESSKKLLAGNPSADTVLDALLDDFLVGEQMFASYADFYASVHDFAKRHPPPPRVVKKRGGRAISLTEIVLGTRGDQQTWMATGNGVVYVAPCGVGLTALRPGRTPERVAEIDGVRGLAVVGSTLYMAEHDWYGDDELNASTNGGRTWKTIATDTFRELTPAPDGGVWATRYGELLHYRPRSGLRTVKTRGNWRVGATGPSGTFAFDDETLVLLPSKRIKQPTDHKIMDVVVTQAGTLLVVTHEPAVLRSLDTGKTWHKVAVAGYMSCAATLSTGAIVVGGEKLLVSQDDGQTFAVVDKKFPASIEAIAELNDEVVLAAGTRVYCVRTAELLGRPGTKSPGVKPLVKRAKPETLPPIETYPAVVREQIWRIEPFDRSKAYIANIDAKSVRVLENGSRVVFTKKLSGERPGRYVVHKDWLVHETYPREVEKERRRSAHEAAVWGTGRVVTARISQ